MKIIEIQPEEKDLVRKFCEVPFSIYKNTPQWVPALQGEVEGKFNHRKNPFYLHSEAAFFLAEAEDGTPIGRVAILNNRNHNEFNKEKTAFFTLFECIDDTSVSEALFSTGFEWAKQRGLNKVNGPKGFTALDGLGLLVKGFEYPAGIWHTLQSGILHKLNRKRRFSGHRWGYCLWIPGHGLHLSPREDA